ncbi:unnamed protein product [Toxocara canis]|uniref:Uncharacterized protein n=1 Tax=Toxocara canis TaxID=6265 RepID=A0A183U6H7_TOXCA|nr:unnamed protein product [Toxocara canis]
MMCSSMSKSHSQYPRTLVSFFLADFSLTRGGNYSRKLDHDSVFDAEQGDVGCTVEAHLNSGVIELGFLVSAIDVRDVRVSGINDDDVVRSSALFS